MQTTFERKVKTNMFIHVVMLTMLSLNQETDTVRKKEIHKNRTTEKHVCVCHYVRVHACAYKHKKVK